MSTQPKTFTTEDCLNQPHVAEEFPRLERIALENFAIPFDELSPKFQSAVRQKAEQEAASDMLAALQKISSLRRYDPNGHNANSSVRVLNVKTEILAEVEAAIQKAEGRL